MSRPGDDTRSVPTATRLSPAERAHVERAARANHQSLSDFQRDALLDRADQSLECKRKEKSALS